MKNYALTKEELDRKMAEIVKAVEEGQETFTIPHYTVRGQVRGELHKYGLTVYGKLNKISATECIYKKI